MTNKMLRLLLAVSSVYLLSTSSKLAKAQCLSDNDDLSIVEDTDLYSIQDFNIELFKRIFPKDPVKNFIFSPYSVWNALVLAYFGSAGETQRQFEKVLRVHDKVSTLRKWRQLEYMYLRREETAVNNTFVLSNRAYFDESVRVRRCMQNILHNEIRQLELINDPSTSADIINQFVSEKTRGHISQLVNPMDIMNSYLVLVNAAYFKGTWQHMFNKSLTKTMAFTTFTKKEIDVPMMVQYDEFGFGYDDENKYDILELPYAGGSISMYIFLPYVSTAQSFQKMINSFTHESLDNNLNNMYPTKMTIFVPKFKIDTVVEDDLLQSVSKMGLIDAFISSKANFTDFSFNRNIKLDHCIHKAFIQVNEEGTEAAAASGFISNKIGGSSMFVCNRPFVFMIRDSLTKNILFTGAFQSPTPEGDAVVQPSTSSPRDQFLPGRKDVRYQPSTFSPVGRFSPVKREDSVSKFNQESQGSIADIPSQSSNYSPREPFLLARESRKPKNVFNPESFRGSVAEVPPQSSNFAPREPFSPGINENSKTNNFRTERSPNPITDIPHQISALPSVGRPLPGANENDRRSRTQNASAETPIRRFFTHFPFTRFVSDDKARDE